jgi:hypothetical protein
LNLLTGPSIPKSGLLLFLLSAAAAQEHFPESAGETAANA